MRCFSLFSGIGGFDLALTNLGHKIVGACEIDRHARQVYSRHFPKIRIWEDATKINPEELPDFELLCAGFPCQAFSVAGKRLGFEESRGTLFFEIARIARQKRPKYLLLENVEGLLNHADGKTFANILATLDELGYDVEWQVFNSKYFVPQGRKRIFIIGHLGTTGSRQVFPLRENDSLSTEQEKTPIARTLTGGGHSGGLHSQMSLIAMPVQIGHAGMNGRRIKNHNEESFTLTVDKRIGLYDGKLIRRFTPTECERLQGFPDGWTEGISDTQRHKALGNAVTVPVVQYIVEAINNN